MSSELTALLEKKGLLILDGAMGTMLQQAGLSMGDCPELWNIEHAATVQNIHEDYLNAGADIIVTNTFGGSPKKLKMFGLQDRTEEINRAGAELALSARIACKRLEAALVCGSVGPTGELLAPLGTATPESMLEQFAVQIRALVDGGVDAIIVETMMCPQEALLAAKAARSVLKSLPVVVNLTYELTPHGPRTMMGTSPESFVRMLAEQNVSVDGVGTNCGTGADDMVWVVDALRKCSTRLPIVAYPNAGMPRMQNGAAVYDESPAEFAQKAARLVEAGATIVGGCCGTTPAHINQLSRRLSNIG
ncbi:MAG: homocysteine S-methyltransferase family protein [Candidatus Coatesbacteria bacterium]|nr:homocysteine S-methyltransferase family protein [Candidatus Coatesbacteria bacterium]